MNAAATAAALARNAEAVCRHYLSNGRRQGRYWMVGDVRNTPGRSMYVRLSGSESGPGAAGRWRDAASAEHGDLLDIVRIRSGASTLRAAMNEASSFLASPGAAVYGGAEIEMDGMENTAYDATGAARRLWRRCRAVGGTHAEAYLLARGLARCRFAALRFHPALRYREGGSVQRLPALVAAVTRHDGRILGIQRTWLDPVAPAKANIASPRKALGRIHGLAVRFGRTGGPSTDVPLLVGEGIETVLSLVAAVPGIRAAAALSAGSLNAFAPPPGVSRIVIARDNDDEGERAAGRLAFRCARAGIAATVIVPDHGDFNDDLVVLGADVIVARFSSCFG